MFVNCSNHPSAQWSKSQLEEAAKWGEIVDFPFPLVPATSDEKDIKKLAEHIAEVISNMKPDIVMCQGEFSLSYAIISNLLDAGIKVVAACSERKTAEQLLEDGTVEKRVVFRFVRFREYVR